MTVGAARMACTPQASAVLQVHLVPAALPAVVRSFRPVAPSSSPRAMTYIGSIDLRRIWIADEEKGLVFAYTMFRHPLDAPNKNYPVLLPDGTVSDRSMNFAPFDLEAAHIYKIFGGKLHEIEAMGFTLPLYSKNGWSPFIK